MSRRETDLMRIGKPHSTEIRRISVEQSIPSAEAFEVYMNEVLNQAKAVQPASDPQSFPVVVPNATPATPQAPSSPNPDSVVSVFFRGMEVGQKLRLQDEQIEALKRRQDTDEARLSVLEDVTRVLGGGFAHHLDAHQEAIATGTDVKVEDTRTVMLEAFSKLGASYKGNKKALEDSLIQPTPKALQAPKEEPVSTEVEG